MTEDRQSYGCGRMYVCVPTRPTIMTNRHHKTPPWRIFGAAVRQRFAYSATTTVSAVRAALPAYMLLPHSEW